METVEQLRGQLDCLAELRTIVKTMKALSAASIRQYEQAVVALASYYGTVELGLRVVLRHAARPMREPHAEPGSAGLGAIVFGSDHGLCGRFNEEIALYALDRIGASGARAGQDRLLAVGGRAATSLEQAGHAVEETLLVPGSAAQITTLVRRVLLKIEAWRETGVETVHVFHNRYSSSNRYEPSVVALLPFDQRWFERLEKQPWVSSSLPTFRMRPEKLLAELIREYLFVTVFRACAESQASEHASRLSAMQLAQRNLDDRIAQATTAFRRARQSAITAELLDVVSGFEAATPRLSGNA